MKNATKAEPIHANHLIFGGGNENFLIAFASINQTKITKITSPEKVCEGSPSATIAGYILSLPKSTKQELQC